LSHFYSEILLTADRDGVWLAFSEIARFCSRFNTYWFIIDMLSKLQTRQFSDLLTNWLRTDQQQNHLTALFRGCMTNHEFVTNVPRPILVGNIPSYKILTEE
jgi:hypothetical protein